MKYLKRIDLENIKNLRDLGGVPTLDKRSTKWHEYFRSASLDDVKDIDINDLKDLTEYCTDMCLYRNNEKVTEDLLKNAFKLRDTIILHKSDKTPVKLVKEKIYNYTLDNQDTVIPFKGTESVVEFLKQNNFSL